MDIDKLGYLTGRNGFLCVSWPSQEAQAQDQAPRFSPSPSESAGEGQHFSPDLPPPLFHKLLVIVSQDRGWVQVGVRPGREFLQEAGAPRFQAVS